MWKGIKAGFDAIDANNDGAVTEDELKKAFPSYHPPNEESEEQQDDQIRIMLEAELGKDGKLSWKDVRKVVKQYSKPHKLPKEAWKHIKKEFKNADKDNNGYVDAAELAAAFEEEE